MVHREFGLHRELGWHQAARQLHGCGRVCLIGEWLGLSASRPLKLVVVPAACLLDSDSCCALLTVLIVLIVRHCQVGGAVHGGEDRGKEKARLRKVGVVQTQNLGASNLRVRMHKDRCWVRHVW